LLLLLLTFITWVGPMSPALLLLLLLLRFKGLVARLTAKLPCSLAVAAAAAVRIPPEAVPLLLDEDFLNRPSAAAIPLAKLLLPPLPSLPSLVVEVLLLPLPAAEPFISAAPLPVLLLLLMPDCTLNKRAISSLLDAAAKSFFDGLDPNCFQVDVLPGEPALSGGGCCCELLAPLRDVLALEFAKEAACSASASCCCARRTSLSLAATKLCIRRSKTIA
jgi:hypothetical protein